MKLRKLFDRNKINCKHQNDKDGRHVSLTPLIPTFIVVKFLALLTFTTVI